MENEILKINILSIAVSGLLMFFSGLVLYFLKSGFISDNIRYFLPIPPIGVAAYIYVFNMFKYYNGKLPGKTSSLVSEIIISTTISSLIFLIFVVLLVTIIGLFIK